MKLPYRLSYSFTEPVKKHRTFVGFIIILTGVCIFCAVLAGIKFSKSSLLISFSNVTIVKFLRGSSGFGGLLFNNILTLSIFSVIIITSCCKKYTISIGIFFYAYFAYAQTLTLIAFMIEYGIINTLIISFCMIIFLIITLILFVELFAFCLECQNAYKYIKTSFYTCLPILTLLGILLVFQCLVFFVLKNYVIVLVY